jgi:phenylacetic acid degradation operon negative regulatory protein
MRRKKQRLAETEFIPGSLVIGIKFTECFNADPLLPPELLPRPWPGREARDLLVRSRRLGILLREEHNKPQLFAPFDDLLGSLI